MEVKTIAILAKSYKRGGWCIAGRELIQTTEGKVRVGQWIRPVTSDEDSKGAIFDKDCRLTGDKNAQVMDIVDIPIASPSPESGQPENYLIVEGQPWTKIRGFSVDSVSKILEAPPNLWLEKGMLTDRITSDYDEGQTITQSL
jgi:hypothetical protein